MMAGIHPNLVEEMRKAKLLDAIGEENVFVAQTGLGAAEDAALEAAQKWLAKPATEASTTEEEAEEEGSAE